MKSIKELNSMSARQLVNECVAIQKELLDVRKERDNLAYALRDAKAVIKNQDGRLADLMDRRKEFEEATTTLESEREANAKLTNENESLRALVAETERDLRLACDQRNASNRYIEELTDKLEKADNACGIWERIAWEVLAYAEKLRDVLYRAAAVFRLYERTHYAKVGLDAEEHINNVTKAERNGALASEMEQAIALEPPAVLGQVLKQARLDAYRKAIAAATDHTPIFERFDEQKAAGNTVRGIVAEIMELVKEEDHD